MMTVAALRSFSVVGLALLVAACSGSAGPRGATGAQGPRGDAGPRGPSGPPGRGYEGGAGAGGSDAGTSDAGGDASPDAAAPPAILAQLTLGDASGVLDQKTFSVLGYSFAISLPVTLGSGVAVGKPVLSPVSLQIQPSGDSALLLQALVSGTVLTSASLALIDPKSGSLVPFASFSQVTVSGLDDSSGTSEVLDLAPGVVQLNVNSDAATYNATNNHETCIAACCSATALGPYVYAADPSWPVAPSETPISNFQIGAAENGAKSSFTTLDFTKGFDDDTLCAFAAAASGKNLTGGVSFDIESPLSAQFGPLDSETWKGQCGAFVTELAIASGPTGPVTSTAVFPGGISFTSRTFDPNTGAVTNSEVTQWSAVTNSPACP
jgi:hypothetical protein